MLSLFRCGLLLAFTAVCLQIAVFLQPLLPKQYQIAPVCETITQALLLPKVITAHNQHAQHSSHLGHQFDQTQASVSQHDHHDPNHQCQYCTVYANLILPPELGVKEVLVRIQIRLVAYQQAFKHVYFALQRLFLLPQGRAPPLSA
ncbi:hypothetical protein L313_0835 [Acinetobacter haemolyticus CIP 64.3 = MTCC 9819]|uniref:DUF2946 domain-containing protein n=1 Tax=Acinetobacter haemolyticus CIP 64.3 = MTCC 9819 TaxID=1217659 RepID=N9GVW5_ACIHA|nr:DUF2946 family protein [Acinetobacter haemolyticus]ENW21386.1 hypothetical protein F927_00198 [Acinetobacter haemolyticus CIP 64.3 = MTCC 9819]EPR89884.1 hypothetical protein L313_0835 [Acinetobacter haemolyticus CIP 64.3 = MTCC 9819]QXZ27376.1 DUF2946 family protein [Acinetobacter haemolyticus]SPT48779.1 Uncharacterised protein [Acinetobacter haemolyticus]SUU66529.1 Uncharacterised protein [Acinetobacter haemolyticus]